MLAIRECFAAYGVRLFVNCAIMRRIDDENQTARRDDFENFVSMNFFSLEQSNAPLARRMRDVRNCIRSDARRLKLVKVRN